jgi:hypothetical protein
MTELLPCPFCGKPARLDEGSDHHDGYFSLGCSSGMEDACPGRYVYYTESIDCLDSAIAKWNTRHVTPLLLDFYNRVCDRAERNMALTGTVSGAHWNAMRQELKALGIEVTR